MDARIRIAGGDEVTELRTRRAHVGLAVEMGSGPVAVDARSLDSGDVLTVLLRVLDESNARPD